jgi:phage terminase large subunit-like protein
MSEFLKLLANAAWRPHKGQLEYLSSKAKFRILACGRRWGKTDAAAAALAATIFESRSSRQMAVAPTLAQARVVFERVLWMLAAVGVAATPSLNPFPKIKVHDGDTRAILHVLDARSGYEAKSLRGFGADNILLDEAAFMPESLVTEVVMPMLAVGGGKMTMISTPNGKNHFYRYFRKGELNEEGFWSKSAQSSENPLVDQSYLALQRDLLTDKAFRREYLAEFIETAGSVFDYDDIQNALSAPKVDIGPVIVGVDWARVKDYTAVVACRGAKSGAEVLLCECWNRTSWPVIVRRVAEVASSVGASLIVCDQNGVGDSVTGDLRSIAKIPIKPFTFTSRSKHRIISGLQWMIEKSRLRLLPDVDLIQELEAYVSKETSSFPKYEASVGHDDRVVALALACSELREGGPSRVLGKERK